MYTKEQIIKEINRIATKLNVNSLSQQDFMKNSMIPMTTVNYYLGAWSQALSEAGLDGKPSGQDPNKDKLLLELIRIYKETGEAPTAALIKKKSKFSLQLYQQNWKSLDDAFRIAIKKYSKKKKKAWQSTYP
jgi:hypothetical protein